MVADEKRSAAAGVSKDEACCSLETTKQEDEVEVDDDNDEPLWSLDNLFEY